MTRLAVTAPALPAITDVEVSPSPSIEVLDVTKRYAGQLALDGISLQIEHGSIVALLGPNGAGKTTLLSVIGGLRVASAGDVSIGGEPADGDLRRHCARLGLLTHESWLYDRLTVRENLALHARLRGLSDDRVDDILFAAALVDVADRPAGACSHGLRKRLSVARMMLHDPDLLLLDEPFSGLDAASQERLGQLIDRCRGTRTVFFSTHDVGRAHRHADRIITLGEGTVSTDESWRPRSEGPSSAFPSTAASLPGAMQRSGIRAFVAAFWALLAKDLLVEFRSRSISAALVVFAGLVALTLMIAFEPFASDPKAAGGVLWVLVTFAALQALSRGFDEDFHDGALRGLRTTGCDPAAVYLAKVASTSLLLVVVGLIGALLVAGAFDSPALVGQLPGILLIVTLAAIGLSAVGGILTVIARHSRMGETLLPIFMLPLSVPLLLAGIETIPWLLSTGAIDGRWLQILILYDVGMLAAGALFFGATLEE
jgi:heme exporter protein A